MLERLQLPFPMWRVHYQLNGGHRRTLLVSLVVASVVAVGVLGYQRFNPREPIGDICAGALATLAVVQCFVLLAGGCNTVHRALQKDYESRMIESHRLTPMTNIGVVLGYMFGAPLQLLALAATILLCGLGLCLVGDIEPGPWVLGNLLIAITAIPLWALVVVLGMRVGKPINPMAFLIAAGALSVPLSMLPGIGLLFGIYSVGLAVAVASGNMPPNSGAIAVSGAVHVVFAVYWVVIAATKYRRPELPALNGWRGLALIVLWTLLGVGGIVGYETIVKRGMRSIYQNEFLTVQWVITLTSLLPIVAMVCAATADYALLMRRGRQPRGWTDRFPDLGGVFIVAMTATALAWLLTSQALSESLEVDFRQGAPASAQAAYDQNWAWAITAAAMVCAGLSARALMLLLPRGHDSQRRGGLLAVVVLVSWWALPPLFDQIRVVYAAGASYSGFIWGFSPPGLVIAAWSLPAIAVESGLVVLVTTTVILTVLTARVR